MNTIDAKEAINVICDLIIFASENPSENTKKYLFGVGIEKNFEPKIVDAMVTIKSLIGQQTFN